MNEEIREETAPEAPEEQEIRPEEGGGQAVEEKAVEGTAEEKTAPEKEGGASPTSEEDLMAMWEEALKEAAQGEVQAEKVEDKEAAPQEKVEVQTPELPEFKETPAQGPHPDLEFILDIPLEVWVEIGRTRMTINELLKLTQGSIIELNKLAGEPVEIYVNGKLMGRGEVVVVNDRFGVRLTEILTPQERIQKLGES